MGNGDGNAIRSKGEGAGPGKATNYGEGETLTPLPSKLGPEFHPTIASLPAYIKEGTPKPKGSKAAPPMMGTKGAPMSKMAIKDASPTGMSGMKGRKPKPAKMRGGATLAIGHSGKARRR